MWLNMAKTAEALVDILTMASTWARNGPWPRVPLRLHAKNAAQTASPRRAEKGDTILSGSNCEHMQDLDVRIAEQPRKAQS